VSGSSNALIYLLRNDAVIVHTRKDAMYQIVVNETREIDTLCIKVISETSLLAYRMFPGSNPFWA
jgi:hypothetical protein